MPQMNESQIKMALTAARNARRDDAALRPADLSARSQRRTHERAVERLLAPCFTQAGVEVDKFEERLAQHHTALRRILEQRKADALKRSCAVKQTRRAALDSRRKTLEHLATRTPLDAPAIAAFEYLDRPFLIWWTQGIDFPETHVESWNSSAKFTLDSNSEVGLEEMSFYFLWTNPSDSYAVTNVETYLWLNGYCQTGSDGGTFPGDRRSALTVDAKVYLLEWWNQPPTSPIWQVGQSQRAVNLSTSTGGWGDPGAIEYAEINQAYDLRYTLFLVPPHESVVFQVALAVSYALSDGSIHIDFASGDFDVVCPHVLVTTQ